MKPQSKAVHTTEISTRGLYEAIREGDERAFGRYYESTIDWLVVLIGRITKDVEEARNIAHDTFVKLWLSREQIDPTQSLDGFVSKVATNAALNYWKRSNAHAKYHAEQLHAKNDQTHSSDARLIAEQTMSRIEEVVRQMPPKRKEAYLLHRNENLTNREIAQRMGLSIQTVKMHIWQAEKKLKETILLIIVFGGLLL